jgi:hypothetical protein
MHINPIDHPCLILLGCHVEINLTQSQQLLKSFTLVVTSTLSLSAAFTHDPILATNGTERRLKPLSQIDVIHLLDLWVTALQRIGFAKIPGSDIQNVKEKLVQFLLEEKTNALVVRPRSAINLFMLVGESERSIAPERIGIMPLLIILRFGLGINAHVLKETPKPDARRFWTGTANTKAAEIIHAVPGERQVGLDH